MKADKSVAIPSYLPFSVIVCYISVCFFREYLKRHVLIFMLLILWCNKDRSDCTELNNVSNHLLTIRNQTKNGHEDIFDRGALADSYLYDEW